MVEEPERQVSFLGRLSPAQMAITGLAGALILVVLLIAAAVFS